MTNMESIFITEDLVLPAISGLITGIPSGLVNIAVYVFTALALYTIATRRGIRNAWLSWVPVANIWVLGSLSDQYRYVVKGQYKSKRKVLITLKLLSLLLSIVTIVLLAAAVFRLAAQNPGLGGGLRILATVAAPGLLLAALSIATAVLRWMALYDLYASCEPNSKTAYLVVSILLPITQPIFLFLCRDKDEGMPPRRMAADPEF